MALIDMKNVCLSYGGPLLLDGVDLAIEPGERICLLGRNGEGKSSLIKIISGDLLPDKGEITRAQGLRQGVLEQEVPGAMPGNVFDVVAGGIGGLGRVVAEYHALSARMEADDDPNLTRRLGEIQHRLEMQGGWQLDQTVTSVISRLELSSEASFGTLSAGLKRRTMLGRALVRKPDILLLDEPTNHLDLDSIGWMEKFLSGFEGSILFVTHDRMFLRRLATRIVELDRGRLTIWPGDYDGYLKLKAAELAAGESQREAFDKKLAQEESWIRQGVKARRTRNEGRVRMLEQMRRKRRERRDRPGMARMNIENAGMSGKIVCEVTGATFAYGDRPVIKDFSTTIMRGDRIGIIGANGAGKTTLLRLLLGEVQPQFGSVRLGANLEIAYFDQLRDQLDGEKSVLENVAGGNTMLTIGGKTRNVYGYLQDFLFAPERARSPVSSLSGGERNRLLLARLFTRPSNLLVLDEPTNDLDVETLELLEELLLNYPGTVLLVSHDRDFLNNVVTSTLVFESDGRVREYVGGYDDWVRQATPISPAEPKPKAAVKIKREKPEGRRKISFKEQREVEALPEQIERLENEQQNLYARLADPALYKEGGAGVVQAKARLETIEEELPHLYARWEELEEIRQQKDAAVV
jgi:ABC transport system ATP-binding/permease protein